MSSIGLNLAYEWPHIFQRQPRRSVAPTTMSHLFRIPCELRDKIYTYALVDPTRPISDYKSADDQHPNTDSISSRALLSTCRQIRTEAYVIYFGKNTFFFSRYSHFDSFLKDLGPEGRPVITSLALELQHFSKAEIQSCGTHSELQTGQSGNVFSPHQVISLNVKCFARSVLSAMCPPPGQPIFDSR